MLVILTQLLLVSILVLFCLWLKKKSQKKKPLYAYLTDPEQFVSIEPVLSDLPKSAVRNTHWFTHTFMRPRKKG